MIDSIKAFVKDNLGGVGMMVAAIVVGFFVMQLGGCVWGDTITRRVPNEIQLATGAPPRATLNECEVFLGAYRDQIKLNYDRDVAMGQLFAEVIAGGWEMAGFFSAAGNLGMTSLQSGAWAGVPAGGAAFGLLTFLGGLLLKGPGTSKEKQKSFNKGQQKALDLLHAVNPTLVVPPDVAPPNGVTP